MYWNRIVSNLFFMFQSKRNGDNISQIGILPRPGDDYSTRLAHSLLVPFLPLWVKFLRHFRGRINYQDSFRCGYELLQDDVF